MIHEIILATDFFLSKNTDAIPVTVIRGRRTEVATYLALNEKLIANIANARKLHMIAI